ncbi:MAG: hypothetical protein JNL18_12150 [Planctomycetaceae bacterium]|nr:hypothetical protein [Planctomycetaceae bacterium]
MEPFPSHLRLQLVSAMASVQNSDFGEFFEFVSHLREHGANDVTPEQSVQEFRDHQEKLRQWNERNSKSATQAAAGLAMPVDLDAMMTRVDARLGR